MSPGLQTGYGPRDFWKNSDAKEFTLHWSIWWGPGCSNEPLRWSWKANHRTRSSGTWCSGHRSWTHTLELLFREFEHNVIVDSVITEAKKCQTELHRWSKANQVSFDPAKESVHIVSRAQPHGDPFKLIGVTFDCMLRMDLCVRETVNQASWKLTTILRTRRFHEVTRLVQVCKSKILSCVEYHTPAVYHAASTILAGIDAIQRHFLRECRLTEEDALDMAMLGLVHRSVFGCGPRHFASVLQFVPPSSFPKHCWQLQSPPWLPKSSETGPFHTGSHRCPQSASSKGG